MDRGKPIVVHTKNGKIEGLFHGGLYVFKGIPYAAPPVGELRWHPPHPVKPWKEVWDGKKFREIAPQNAGLIDNFLPDFAVKEPQDENCLYLNIWSPGLEGVKRPVMVWIHGGAFTIGSGSTPVYNGATLASKGNLLVITINYRLGPLGFMNLNEVTGGKIPATGNEGLLDQIAALEWIKENIEAFGGDPNNITLFGESAGAMSIGCLMAMPKAQGLFHKVILQSGVPNTAVSLDEAIKISQQFIEIIGLKGSEADQLMKIPVDQLLSAQQKLLFKTLQQDSKKITVTAPVVDGKVIPDWPMQAIAKGSCQDVPAIIGCNLEEWKLFSLLEPNLSKLDEPGLLRRWKHLGAEESIRKLIETYRKAKASRGENTSPREILSAIETDFMFRIPGIRMIESLRQFNPSIYNYLFTWRSPALGGELGACHVLEIGFVFGTYNNNFFGSGPEADVLARNMQEAWISFARTGNPSNDKGGVWPPYGDRRKTMIFGRECFVTEAPYDEERQAWDLFL